MTSAVTAERMRRFAPACPLGRAQIIGDILREEVEAYQVSTPQRLHHFLAQLALESAGFCRLEENLSYSAARLMQVWPSRFGTLKDAQVYERRPHDLAEKVYGGRMGNTRPGDGWKYRGRGLIQITGRDNYATFGRALGLPLSEKPDLAALADHATRIALAYWKMTGCNLAADADDLEGVTRRINGGLVKLEDRARWVIKARRVFT